jgi:predicted metal-binding membrane protein
MALQAGITPAFVARRWVYLVAGLAAAAIVAGHLSSHPPVNAHVTEAVHAHMPGMAETQSGEIPLGRLWMWWVLMSAAMMLPLAAGEADRIAADSLWRRRRVAVVEYLGGYLAVWSIFGLMAIWAVIHVWPAGAPAVAPALALLAAALWQVTPTRKRALRRCGIASYVEVRGWHADRDCLLAGTAYGRRCLVTCAPVMTVMAVTHSAIVMFLLAVLLYTERAPGPNPAQRAGRPQEAVCLAALAAVVGGCALASGPPLP